jgi:hypothetical protein
MVYLKGSPLAMRRLVIVVAFALLAAGSATAKEGVEATILSRIPTDAAAGTSVRVEWRLAELESGRPFGAGGIFIRLVGAGGATTTADAEETRLGRFVAKVVVPDGGIRRIRIGLHGWTSDARGTRTADMFFRIVNDPFSDVWTTLRRPLHVPTLGRNRTCPVAHPATGVDFARFGVGRGIGPGPTYPIGWADATIPIGWQRNDVDATLWGVQKVLWFVQPRYRGPVLVRGVGLDNPYRVRFERGRIPPAELRLPEGTRERPSYVRIRKPGCYAFQIDGLSFSRSIVFRAVRD